MTRLPGSRPTFRSRSSETSRCGQPADRFGLLCPADVFHTLNHPHSDDDNWILTSPAATMVVMHGLSNLPAALRILFLGFLMLGTLVQPVILFAGELHGVQHAVSSGDHAQDKTVSSSPAEPSEPTTASHVMMELGECCGSVVALLPLGDLGFNRPTAMDPLPLLWTTFQTMSHPVALRPPITA